MNEATLDRWITMRMLTEEVGEVDLDGYRITVVERAVEKLHFEDPEFEYTIRITKLNVRGTAYEDQKAALRRWIEADAAAYVDAFKTAIAPKRKAAKPKGKAK